MLISFGKLLLCFGVAQGRFVKAPGMMKTTVEFFRVSLLRDNTWKHLLS